MRLGWEYDLSPNVSLPNRAKDPSIRKKRIGKKLVAPIIGNLSNGINAVLAKVRVQMM